jgi:hypothetical protein
MATFGNSNRGMVFSLRSMSKRCKQDSWSNDLVEERLPAVKNVSTEAEDIVGIHNQATTVEDTAD